MAKRRISVVDIVVGQPLPWNAYDSNGRLLLHAGEVVANAMQVERMVAQGLFSEMCDSVDESADTAPKEAPSTVRMINRANDLLRNTLPKLRELDDAEGNLLRISQLILDAVKLDSEVAVACISLNQEAAPYVIRHCVDTAIVAALIAQAMSVAEDKVLYVVAAALTANLGMLDYQEELNRKTEPLTKEEKSRIHQHPKQSVEMLQTAGITQKQWVSYVLYHHENEDGSGYPIGKIGDEIPLGAKLIGLADRYCARVTNVGYQKQALPSKALRDLLLNNGKDTAPQLAAYFIKVIGLYPSGVLVMLSGGEAGIVIGKDPVKGHPLVRVTISKSGSLVDSAIIRDTSKPMYAIKEELPKQIAGTQFAMSKIWGEVAAF
jgi:HD-GYP domain-containing protein (c-di-GMP phosphodiesterase class II)